MTMETSKESMIKCTDNQRALIRGLTYYLNEKINLIDDDRVLDDVCATVNTVGDNLKALIDIYTAFEMIDEDGELGQLRFERMTWKDGKRQNDRNSN